MPNIPQPSALAPINDIPDVLAELQVVIRPRKQEAVDLLRAKGLLVVLPRDVSRASELVMSTQNEAVLSR